MNRITDGLVEQLKQMSESQGDHTPACIKHKATFGSIGCTCKPDQSSRLLTEQIAKELYYIDHLPEIHVWEKSLLKDLYLLRADKILAITEADHKARIEALIDETTRFFETLNWNPDYHGAYMIPRPMVKAFITKLKANPTSEVEG